MRARKKRGFVSIFLSLILALTMLPGGLGLMPFGAGPERAYAANGPNKASDNNAYIQVPELTDSQKCFMLYPRKYVSDESYDPGTSASYNESSNTLTLNNFDHPEMFIEVNEMGDDFTINLVGDNAIGQLSVWGFGYGGSLRITGSGSLAINSNGDAARYGGYYAGLRLEAEGSNSVLRIEGEPEVSINGYEGGQAVTILASSSQTGIYLPESVSGINVMSENVPESVSVGSGNDSIYGTLYTYNGGYYAVTYSAISTSASLTEYYSVYRLTGTPQSGFSAYEAVADEQNLASLPGKYEIVYDSLYNYTLADNRGNVLSSVSFPGSNDGGGGDTLMRPSVWAFNTPGGKTGVPYAGSAILTPANGGEIVTYEKSSGADWLSISDEGQLSGTPTESGSFSFAVKGVELLGERMVESMSRSFTISVLDPAVSLVLGSSLPEGYHILTVTKGEETVLERNLGYKALPEGTVLDLGRLAPGDDYRAQIKTTGSVSTEYAKQTFRVVPESEDGLNRISYNPGEGVIKAGPSSLIVHIDNFGAIQDFDPVVELTYSNSLSRRLYAYSANAVFSNVFRNMQSDDYSVRLLIRDGSYNEYEIVKAENQTLAAENNVTLSAANTPGLKKYRVSTSPQSINVSSLTIDGSSYAIWGNSVEDRYIVIGEGKAGSIGNAKAQVSYNEDINAEYDVESPAISVSGNSVSITYARLERNATVSGRVIAGGQDLAYASVTVSQNVNGVTGSVSAVTDGSGGYSVSGLVPGKELSVTASKSGYRSETKKISGSLVQAETAAGDISLEKKGVLSVYIADGSVKNPHIKLSKKEGSVFVSESNYFSPYPSGTSIEIDIPENASGTYKVELTSEDTSGTASAEVNVENGIGACTLSPVRKGVISWANLDTSGVFFYLFDQNNNKLGTSSGGIGGDVFGMLRLDPGTYTAYITKEAYYQNSGTPDADNILLQKNFVLEAGELIEITDGTGENEIDMSGIEGSAYRISGGLSSPEAAAPGELYKISGTIDKIDGDITSLVFTNSGSGVAIRSVAINGKLVSLSGGGGNPAYAYKDNNPDADWSTPASVSIWCSMEADSEEAYQSVSMDAEYTPNGLDESKKARIGAASTKLRGGLSLLVPSVIGSIEHGDKVYGPGYLDFYGRGPAGRDISIYDNGVLCAVVKANNYGVFEGRAELQSSSRFHTIRAEAAREGAEENAQEWAEAECVYNPAGAVLKDLWFNSYKLSIIGKPASYTATPSMSIQYKAGFDNPSMLKDITVDLEGKEETGKVFFLMYTASGGHIIPAHELEGSDGVYWESDLMTLGKELDAGEYPTGVKVIYASDTFKSYVEFEELTGVSGSARSGYSLGSSLVSGSDALDEDLQSDLEDIFARAKEEGRELDFTAGADYSQNISNASFGDGEEEIVAEITDLKALYDEWAEKVENGTEGFDASTHYEGEPNAVLSSMQLMSEYEPDIYDYLASLFTKAARDAGDNDARFGSASPKGASDFKVGADTVAQITYTDQPSWTTTHGNVLWRFWELRDSGYKMSESVDKDGRQVFSFNATFFYDDYKKPLGNKPGTKNLFSDEADGSMLNVSYYYINGAGNYYNGQDTSPYNKSNSLAGGKWYRHQEAVLTTGAQSPIHTLRNEVPRATQRPSSYVSASELNTMSLQSVDEGGMQLMAGSYIPKYFNPCFWMTTGRDRIRDKTWRDLQISLASYGYGKKCEALAAIGKGGATTLVEFGKYGKYGKITYEQVVTAAGVKIFGELNRDTGTGLPPNLDGFHNTLTKNLQYYRKLRDYMKEHNHEGKSVYDSGETVDINNFDIDIKKCDAMIEKTLKMIKYVDDVNSDVAFADIVNNYIKNVSAGFGFASLGCIFIDGGAETGLMFDVASFEGNALNDNIQADVADVYLELMMHYYDYAAGDLELKNYISEQNEWRSRFASEGSGVTQLPQDVESDPMRPSDSVMKGNHDPSGIVYEGVLSAPVEGATVTLFRYDETQGGMVQHDDSIDLGYLGQQNPLTTGEDGRYSWDVPVGEWFVKARAEGYEPGDSNLDTAAGGSHVHDGVNYLPVLPPQLDVNIPLVSYEPPQVAEIKAREEGVYVVFSKYMNEDTLVSGNFELRDENGEAVEFTLQKEDSERAPSNISYEGEAPSYTKTVLLKTAKLNVGDELSLSVMAAVHSYADVSMAEDYNIEGATVEREPEPEPDNKPNGGGGTGGSTGVVNTVPIEESAEETPKTAEEIVLELLMEQGLSEEEAKEIIAEAAENYGEFSDLKEGAWYEEAVKAVLALGLMNGVSEESFEPNGLATREQVIAVLHRLSALEGKGLSAAEDFDSAKAEEAAAKAAAWAKEDIIWAMKYGISDGSMPKEYITREQFVTMLSRLEGGKAGVEGAAAAYSDSGDISSWAKEAAAWAVEEGLLSGYPDNTLRPKNNLTRAELATLMTRSLK